MKNLANAITASRFAFARMVVLAEPFSALFWVGYGCGGLSDLIDGPLVRRYYQQSAFGAKLDSAADIVFIFCAGIAIFRGVALPAWVLILAGVIALVRFASYGVGYRKFRTFAALFAFPVVFFALGIDIACGVIGVVALLAAVEELILMIRLKELDRDLFLYKKTTN